MLLDLGASLEESDHSKRTALYWAIRANQAPSVKFLLERGACLSIESDGMDFYGKENRFLYEKIPHLDLSVHIKSGVTEDKDLHELSLFPKEFLNDSSVILEKRSDLCEVDLTRRKKGDSFFRYSRRLNLFCFAVELGLREIVEILFPYFVQQGATGTHLYIDMHRAQTIASKKIKTDELLFKRVQEFYKILLTNEDLMKDQERWDLIGILKKIAKVSLTEPLPKIEATLGPKTQEDDREETEEKKCLTDGDNDKMITILMKKIEKRDSYQFYGFYQEILSFLESLSFDNEEKAILIDQINNLLMVRIMNQRSSSDPALVYSPPQPR